MKAFALQIGFRLVHSSFYYAQANGQAEATNKVLIDMIKKTVEDKPGRWHEVLCAYRNSKNNATSLTPYRLTYGQDVVLPLLIVVNSLRVAKQHGLQLEEYTQAMFQQLESTDEDRLVALENIQANKAKASKLYNKKVKLKCFVEGELVQKVTLPIGTRTAKFGKWSPNWEGPFIITQAML